ncbi:putative AT DNA binding protein, partial [Aspergillus brunneoviolaceus CBS 621.78]
SSSSPDILGPSGDSDYLISSPFKPFTGRQSFMSPADFNLLQSPRTTKRQKRSRLNLTPGAHSFEFNDVVLPASPNLKLNRKQQALSPDKLQSDGNVSPWRIRVTLEATQDQENNNDYGSPTPKRLRPSAMVTKIPLKDESEQTPRRRRGRPRKSDTLLLDARPAAGSPGHTPGPPGSAQKRKRGRPRKTPLKEDAVARRERDIGTLDIDMDTPTAESRSRWSPLNLTGDAGSDEDDGGFPQDEEMIDIFDDELSPEQSAVVDHDSTTPRVTFEATYDTPQVDHLDNEEYNLNSTPSKMPSPVRELQSSSSKSMLHAGHTPRPPHLYPTPTTSSPVAGEETVAQSQRAAAPSGSRRTRTSYGRNDPTDEHKEFDSIMESEGFSMVSLDTLPSAKQHGLGGDSNSKIAKNALKPFLKRESNGVLRQRTSLDPETHGGSKPVSHAEIKPTLEQQVEDHPRTRIARSVESNTSMQHASGGRSASTRSIRSSSAVPTLRPVQEGQRPLLRLVRIIRAGIALQGPLTELKEGKQRTLQYSDSALTANRQRLQLLFQDLNPQSQQVLQAGLAFGQQLAKQRQVELETYQQSLAADAKTNARTILRSREASSSKSPPPALSAADFDTPGSVMRRRMEEWQREREAISREIQMANSSQVIVIDSDRSDQSDLAAEQDEEWNEDDGFDNEPEEAPSQDGYVEAEQANEEDDDEGYEDIWQQEALEQGNQSHRLSMLDNDKNDLHPRQHESSPWKTGWTPARSQTGRLYSPAHWTKEQDTVPFLGRSRVKQLREENVDLTNLYRGDPTPKRRRYYYGEGSPSSDASQSQSEGGSPSNQASYRQGVHEHASEHDRLSEHSIELSSHSDLEEGTFQIDPTTRLEMARQNSGREIMRDEVESLADAAAAEGQYFQAATDNTPDPPRRASPDNQASSWFQKITSLTPGWLKAPKSFRPASPREENPVVYEEEAVTTTKSRHARDEFGSERLEGIPGPSSHFTESGDEQQFSPDRRSYESLDDARDPFYEEVREMRHKRQPTRYSGHFSNDHYRLLHNLYRLSKKHPERFPYYPAPGRTGIIGDWIWTSDGVFGVPVTEDQFAIIDRFAQQVSRDDIRAGGTGQITWTEADLHRRLISIIIGEQIRKERRPMRYRDYPGIGTSRSRDTVYETWR